MKSLTTLLFFLLITGTVYSQFYCDYNIDFEDTSQYFRIEIDTISNSENIWQIGAPQKAIFTSAYSVPNAILTDTANPYPVNDTSMFVVKHLSVCGGFQWSHTVILSGKYQIDSDTLNDFGTIEFSPDNGNTWVDLLTDTTYLNQGCYSWWSEEPTLTGKSPGWADFYAWVAGFGQVFNIQPFDTVQYRFRFISDSVQTNKDGLMYDNLHFEDWFEGIKNIQNQLVSKSFPNPTKDIITIEFENIDNSPFEVAVYNESGSKILLKKTTNQSSLELDLRHISAGIYYYRLTNLKSREISFGKIVKE